LNPRPAFRRVRDFQSRSFGRSDTSPRRRQRSGISGADRSHRRPDLSQPFVSKRPLARERGQPLRDGAPGSSPRRGSARSLTRNQPRRSRLADAEQAKALQVQIPHLSVALLFARTWPWGFAQLSVHPVDNPLRTLAEPRRGAASPNLSWSPGACPVAALFGRASTLSAEDRRLTRRWPVPQLARSAPVTAICGDRGVELLLPAPVPRTERLGECA
jgi:hypothetical protein